jgi:hypothetical protein
MLGKTNLKHFLLVVLFAFCAMPVMAAPDGYLPPAQAKAISFEYGIICARDQSIADRKYPVNGTTYEAVKRQFDANDAYMTRLFHLDTNRFIARKHLTSDQFLYAMKIGGN